jgi:hypothetical protein
MAPPAASATPSPLATEAAAAKALAVRIPVDWASIVIAPGALKNKKSLNVALLGALSSHLEIPEEHWLAAVQANLAEKLHKANEQSFALGRAAAAGSQCRCQRMSWRKCSGQKWGAAARLGGGDKGACRLPAINESK